MGICDKTCIICIEHIHSVQYLSAFNASITNADNIAKSVIKIPTSGCANLFSDDEAAIIVNIIPRTKIITARRSGCPPLIAA